VEPHTIETLQAMFEAMKVYRGMIARKGSVRGIMDIPPEFVKASPLQAHAEMLGQAHQTNDNGHHAPVRSLRDRLKKVSNEKSVPKAEPVTVPQEVKLDSDTTKNPNRVAAGRRNAAKRWEVNRDRRRR
jgi:hypothetical protein